MPGTGISLPVVEGGVASPLGFGTSTHSEEGAASAACAVAVSVTTCMTAACALQCWEVVGQCGVAAAACM